ncbi:hypothetical protein KID03_09495 [bacterium]|nr:hypothetical protein [bacterium]
MNFDEKDLLLAQKKGIISSETFEKLLDFLTNLNVYNTETNNVCETAKIEVKKKFTLENFLYYFGALIIICAMGWYLGNTFDTYGNGGLLALSVLYFAIFAGIGNLLWKNDKKTPGGLLYVCAVSVVPLAGWAFERLIGIMPDGYDSYSKFHVWSRSGFILMEIATICVGLIFLKFRKFPLLILPICWALWYLSMDIVPLCLGNISEPTWGMRNFATTVFAILMLGAALKLDKKTNEDYSKWLYIFGATMLWFAILSILIRLYWNNEIAYFLFAMFSLLYMIVSILLQRKVFMIWGAIGVFGYIGHLAYTVFKDSPLFVLSLVILGLVIIFSGAYYAKNCDKIETNLRAFILNGKKSRE